MVRRCWVNFQCLGILLIWFRVGQGPIALAVGAGGGFLDIFSLVYHFSFLSPSLWERVRYRLKYCLKGSLTPNTSKQARQVSVSYSVVDHCLMLFMRLHPDIITKFCNVRPLSHNV